MKTNIVISNRSHIIMVYFAAQCDKAVARGMAATNAQEAERASYELGVAVRDLLNAISTCAGHAISRSRS